MYGSAVDFVSNILAQHENSIVIRNYNLSLRWEEKHKKQKQQKKNTVQLELGRFADVIFSAYLLNELDNSRRVINFGISTMI